MTKTYYDLLGVASTAPADEIKRAFRREIAKYHPDKVQHLGREFQEIAAVRAAELTQAYKTLSDETLRADYDAQLSAGGAGAAHRPEAPPPPAPPAAAVRPVPPQPPAVDPERPARRNMFSTERAGATDVLRRAAIARFRRALDVELGRCDEMPVRGFEIACTPPKGRFWNKLAPHVLARVVPHVDAAAVSETWDLASRLKRDEARDICVFLMGPEIAPLSELARAIAEEWRRPRAAGGKLYLTPVNTRSWTAHIPNDAPPVVKALVGRLKSA